MRLPLALCAILAALVTAGCGSRVIDLRDPPDPDTLPAPSTPEAAVMRLEWAWNRRDPAPLEDLFTADYRFECSGADTTLPDALFRGPELEFSNRLFVSGTATRPPARNITLVLDRPLVVEPDSALPMPWHARVSSGLSIGIRVPDGDYRVSGSCRFTLVRGDSARIPQELVDQGYRPDSTRWWIRRWEDVPSAPRTTPSRLVTVTTIKALYLDLLPHPL